MSKIEPVLPPATKITLDATIATKVTAETTIQNAAKAALVSKDGVVGQVGWTDKRSGFVQVLAPVALPTTAVPQTWTDVYDGPQGRGWILRSRALVAGEIFEKAVDMGPEGRSADWKAPPDPGTATK